MSRLIFCLLILFIGLPAFSASDEKEKEDDLALGLVVPEFVREKYKALYSETVVRHKDGGASFDKARLFVRDGIQNLVSQGR